MSSQSITIASLHKRTARFEDLAPTRKQRLTRLRPARGLMDAVGYPENPKPQSAWAQWLIKTHANAVENLVVFATLVLVAHALGISNSAIASASVVYFWARVVHALGYTLAVPWVRTLSFTVGFVAQAVIAWQILMK